MSVTWWEQVTSLLGTQPQWYVHPTKAAIWTAFDSSVICPSLVKYLILYAFSVSVGWFSHWSWPCSSRTLTSSSRTSSAHPSCSSVDSIRSIFWYVTVSISEYVACTFNSKLLYSATDMLPSSFEYCVVVTVRLFSSVRFEYSSSATFE